MRYCTRIDLEHRLGLASLAVLGDADQDGAEDVATVDLAIGDIHAKIDGALAIRWPQYRGQASRVLTLIAVDLVAYQVARGLARSEELCERAAAAQKDLDAIAAGRLHPCPDEATAARVQGRVYTSGPGRRLTRGSLGSII